VGVQKLAHAEQLFASKFPDVSEACYALKRSVLLSDLCTDTPQFQNQGLSLQMQWCSARSAFVVLMGQQAAHVEHLITSKLPDASATSRVY
jgi:hypothetical protein